MPRLGPGARSEIGAAVLAAAEVVDTQVVQRRVTTFAATHRRYMNAQRAVEAAEAPLAAAQAQLAQRDREQDESITLLARALVRDRQPRANPFRAFGVPSPAAMQRLAVADEAKTIHRLVAAVQQSQAVSKHTRQVAQAADDAACAVELALASIDQLQAAVRVARLARDAIGHSWDRDLAALKRAARAAADEGAPHLHAALFSRGRRSAG